MLAVSTFLGLIQKWTNFHFEELRVTFYADNKSLIARQTNHLAYTNTYPNCTLNSEFDLTEEIFRTHSQYHITATFCHVKGHQDNQHNIEHLSIPARLNVFADKLATRFYKEGHHSSLRVYATPSHAAHLIIQGVSITNDYNKQLLRAYTEPQYIQYLQDKFQWDIPTVISIHWKALRSGLRRIQRHCLTTKIVNNILPTAKVLHRWKQQPTDACQLCGDTEYFAHMFRCTHPNRRKWRKQFITAIRDTLANQKTQIETMEFISHIYTDFFEQGAIECSDYDPQYHNIIQSQSQIGWIHMFMGRYANRWDVLSTNEHWMTALVEATLQQVITLWETRNAEVHGQEDLDQQKCLLRRQRHVISELLKRQPYCLPSDDFLFPQDPQALLQKTSTTELGNWILTRRPAILNSQKQAKERALANTKPITSWFRPFQQRLQKVKQWHRDKLLYDPFHKKKRHKEQQPATSTCQHPITRYFSLLKTF